MTIGKPSLIAIGALLLVLVTYAASSAFGPGGESAGGESAGDEAAPGFSRLFPGGGGDLEKRVRKLEDSLEKSHRIQTQLLELVDELRQGLEQSPADAARGNSTSAASETGQAESRSRNGLHHRRFNRFRKMQLQRLIDAGLNPDRAEFILDKQERFQYEHMKLSYEYRHMSDKSSAEAKALQEQLSIHSHPRKMLEHQLSEQEFEAYLRANGGGQEMQVDRVVDNTPAATAGLHPGDKIISYNGERVFHMGDLRTQIYRVEPGETVPVEVQRAGSSSRETIYLPSGPLGIQG